MQKAHKYIDKQFAIEKQKGWNEKTSICIDNMPKTTKQCGFVVAHNYDKGILLLEAYKKNKGTHYQLPGGNIDKDEIERYGIVEGARRAAARELWEETGIDMRNNIERLQQIPFPASHQTRLGRRLFFYLRVLNDESENIKLHAQIEELNANH